MNNKTYDILKTVTFRVLPPVYTLIAAVFAALGYDGTVALAIIGAVITCIGQILGVSGGTYAKNQVAAQANAEGVEQTDNSTKPEDVDDSNVRQTPAVNMEGVG